MRFNHKQLGQLEVQSTYMENVNIRSGGNLSLYWANNENGYRGLIVHRKGKKTFLSSAHLVWEEAKRFFTNRIVREGSFSKTTRKFHSLNLYFQLDTQSDQWRCIAICKEGKKFVDVLHVSKIGCLALVFQGMKKECGCRHKKRYDELDYYSFRALQGSHFQSRVSQSMSI